MLSVGRNTLWLLLDRSLRIIIVFVVSVAVARYLGPSRYGDLSYVLSLFSLFQFLATLGMDGVAIRDVAREPNDAPRILGTVLQLRLWAGVANWIIFAVVSATLQGVGSPPHKMACLLGAALMFQGAETIDLWFQSQLQSKRAVISRAAGYIIGSGVRIILVTQGAGLVAFSVPQVVESCSVMVLLALAYRKHPTPGAWAWHAATARRMLRQNWPLLLSGLSIIVYTRIDQLMLQHISGAREVGIFSAAISLSQPWLFVPLSIFASLVPSLARWHSESVSVFFARLQLVYSAVVLLALPIVAGLVLFAPTITAFVYGSSYSDASRPLAIHAIGTLFIALGSVQAMWIFRPNQTWLTLIQTGMGATVSVISNLLLMPTYGATGAAMSVLVAQFCSTFLVNFVLDRRVFVMQIRALTFLEVRPLLRMVGGAIRVSR
jgi:O-antigen/teichoic acid export membrane protein